MITIVDVGKRHDKDKDIMGWRNYEVRINEKVICKFQHHKSNGLAQCLLKASEAIEKKTWPV